MGKFPPKRKSGNLFRRYVDREIELYITEQRNGCVDCIALDGDGLCNEHYYVAMDIAVHPRKYLNLRVPNVELSKDLTNAGNQESDGQQEQAGQHEPGEPDGCIFVPNGTGGAE